MNDRFWRLIMSIAVALLLGGIVVYEVFPLWFSIILVVCIIAIVIAAIRDILS